MHTISSHTLPANHTIPYQTKPHHSMYTISSHTLLPYHTIPYQTIPNHIPYQAMPHQTQTIIYCTPHQYTAHHNLLENAGQPGAEPAIRGWITHWPNAQHKIFTSIFTSLHPFQTSTSFCVVILLAFSTQRVCPSGFLKKLLCAAHS